MQLGYPIEGHQSFVVRPKPIFNDPEGNEEAPVLRRQTCRGLCPFECLTKLLFCCSRVIQDGLGADIKPRRMGQNILELVDSGLAEPTRYPAPEAVSTPVKLLGRWSQHLRLSCRQS